MRASTATSPTASITDLSKFAKDGHVNSPARRKAKKAKQKVAHSIILSNDSGLTDHLACMASKISGVMGSLTLLPLGAECHIPFKIYVSWGRDDRSGSGSPEAMW